MPDGPKDRQEGLFSYELDPETESDELDRHRARFAGLTLHHYRIMRAYAAFKRQCLEGRWEEGSAEEGSAEEGSAEEGPEALPSDNPGSSESGR